MRQLLSMSFTVTLAAAGVAAAATPVPAADEPAEAAAPPSSAAAALDADRERLARDFAPANVVELEAGSEAFVAVYHPPVEDPRRGAVMLVLPAGAGPARYPALRPLLTDLPRGGWATLAVPGSAAADPEPDVGSGAGATAARIEAGLAHLANHGWSNVVIAAPGPAVAAVTDWLTPNASPAVVGLIAIGHHAAPLVQTDRATLDVFGARDRPARSAAAGRQATAAVDAVDSYQQRPVAGAGSGFEGFERILARRIRGWLDRTAAGTLASQ